MLDFVVVDDALFIRIDEEHLARFQAAFIEDVFRRDVDDADFGTYDDPVVAGDIIAGRTQAVAVEHASSVAPVAEEQGGRPVPRFHQDGVVLIESLQVFADGVLVVEGLRHQHGHGVGQAQAGHDEKLQYVVQ